MTDSPAQQCVREWFKDVESLSDWDDVEALDQLASHIDALVRRERDGAVKPLADAVQAFRNLPQLGRLVKLRATPEYVALVDAWDRVAGRYCACGPDVPAHDGVCQGCERVIRGCD